MKGTYRRDYEGDFLCSEEAVRAMFADQRDGGTDTEVLDNMELDALNTGIGLYLNNCIKDIRGIYLKTMNF